MEKELQEVYERINGDVAKQSEEMTYLEALKIRDSHKSETLENICSYRNNSNFSVHI